MLKRFPSDGGVKLRRRSETTLATAVPSDAAGRLPGQMPPSHPKRDPDPRATARYLHERGYAIRRIAAFLEVSPMTAWRWVDPANEAKARQRVRAARARDRNARRDDGRVEEVSAGR